MKFILLILAIITVMFSYMISSGNDNPVFGDREKPADAQIEKLLSQMTLEEKISMIHANSKFTTAGIERLGIPPLHLSDGPHGIREEIQPYSWEPAGWTNDSSSYFPTGTALAATWNPDLAHEVGNALGEEARARNKDVLLGPAINIHRTPLCGRNFEYMSEDPYLISQMVVPYIQGVQERNVAACVKHYVLNNQEYDRDSVNVKVDLRTLHEIYLPGFKAAVKEGKVLTVMGAYNKFQNDFCCGNNFLINDILKSEWGFPGFIMSDWNATHSTVKSANAGLDLEMGTDVKNFDDYYFAKPLLEAIKKGQVEEKVVDDKVRRILRVMFQTKMFEKREQGSFNTLEHQMTAHKVAREAIVLLKNEGGLLPLNKTGVKSIAVIGDNAKRKHARGGYSSGIKALYEITPLQGLINNIGNKVQINYALGYEKTSKEEYGIPLIHTPNPERAEKLLQEAVATAEKSDVAIIFAGLNHDYDTEGKDRPDMKLPYNQDELIQAVYQANPKTIVVLISGSPVEMNPWVNEIPAILQAWFAGMEGGTAMAEVLFGEVNPSGKLPFTFPKKLSDSPAHKIGDYPGKNLNVEYKEGILVGYRYFDTKKVEPLFPFGHGLSYTQFEYSDLKIHKNGKDEGLPVEVRFKIKNVGNRFGEEVPQLYVSDIEASVVRPAKELKKFTKIKLQAGEEKQILLELDQDAFSYYDVNSSSWVVEPGKFGILIGSSSRDIRLSGKFNLNQKY
jgi:beta-glucosidase